MANQKIIDLNAIVTQSSTDLSETSANGTGSFKETRAQKQTYIQANLNNVTITGGTINGTSVGATTPSTGAFTTLSATTPLPASSGGTGINNGSATLTLKGTPYVFENTGSSNVSFGTNSLSALTSGTQNVAIGTGALANLTSSSDSVAIGYTAGQGQTGANNVFIGASAGFASGSGGQHIGIGENALFSVSTSNNNIGIGNSAGDLITTGSSNVVMGQSSGAAIVSGSNNTLIGDSTNVSSSSATNRVALGQGITVSSDNTIVLGNTSVTTAKIANTTYPTTATANQILYSSATNTVSGLSTANNGVVATNGSGVPSVTSTLPLAVQSNITQTGTLTTQTIAPSFVANGTGNTGFVELDAQTSTPSSGAVNSVRLHSGATGHLSWQEQQDGFSRGFFSTLTASRNYTLPDTSGVFVLSGATVDVTGTSQSMSTNITYAANNAGLVTLTLPSVANEGDYVTVYGKGTGGWKIAQNSGQIIHINSSSSTTGTGGSIASTNQWNCVTLVCVTANTTWVAHPVTGSLTIV
ncbi:MAG: beta strand repeat-containing protein [Nitrosotalea sp.]